MTGPRHSLRRPARLSLIALGLGCMALAPAFARDLTPPERTALVKELDGFSAAVLDGDWAGVVAVLPPRMVAWIAAQRGIDAKTERQSIQSVFDKAKNAGLRMSMTYDLDHARFASLQDGTPYVVVPMHGVEDTPHHKDFQVKALALLEEGKWYLLSLGTAVRLERLRKAYPEFAGVSFDDAPAKP